MKRVINYLFVLAAMSCSLTSCNSSDDDLGNEYIVPPQETVTITDTRKSIATEMLTIPYHELAFSTSGNTEKPCLVIYLHGGTSSGDDNEKQMEEAGIDSISNYLKAHQKNAVFLIPQCPNRQYWIGPAKNVLGELIDQYVADGKVDAKQIYLLAVLWVELVLGVCLLPIRICLLLRCLSLAILRKRGNTTVILPYLQ